MEYALEGSIAVAGVGIRWLRDNLGCIESAEASEEVAASVPDTAGTPFPTPTPSQRQFCRTGCVQRSGWEWISQECVCFFRKLTPLMVAVIEISTWS